MPYDSAKLVLAKEKFATGWQDTGLYSSLAQCAKAANLDPKSVTTIQKREKAVSMRVMTKYANALGLEVSDVISSDTKDAARRSHVKIDKTADWIYEPAEGFGYWTSDFEESIKDVSLNPVGAREIIDASTNWKCDPLAWDYEAYPQPIWLLDDERTNGFMVDAIGELSDELESVDKVEGGDERRHSLSLIAKNLARAARVEEILANLKRQSDLHVLGGAVSTYLFNYEMEPEFRRYGEATFPLFLITSVSNVTASVAVNVLIEKK